MLTVEKMPGQPVAVINISGRLDGAQMVREVDRGYREGLLRPGGDRLAILYADTDDSDLGASDLAGLRGIVLHWERRGGAATGFRSVFLALSDRMAVLADIYMSLWDLQHGTIRPQHVLVRDYEAAERALGGRGAAVALPLTHPAVV